MLCYVKNSHWILETKTIRPTNKIPKEYIHIENILPLKTSVIKLLNYTFTIRVIHISGSKYPFTILMFPMHLNIIK